MGGQDGDRMWDQVRKHRRGEEARWREPLPCPLDPCPRKVLGEEGTCQAAGLVPITSCPHPCSWDMCRPCGVASPRAGPLQIGPAPSAAGSGWGSAH